MSVAQTLITRAVPENKVKNMTGHDLGRIEELLIDSVTGQPRVAILSFGGFLGVTDRLFAVPWDTLVADPRTHTYYLRMDSKTLRELPKFSRLQRDAILEDELCRIGQYPVAIAC